MKEKERNKDTPRKIKGLAVHWPNYPTKYTFCNRQSSETSPDEMREMSRLQFPARKLLLEQVKTAAHTGPHPEGSGLQTWNIQLKDKQLNVSIVWVQGTVTKVTISGQAEVYEECTLKAYLECTLMIPFLAKK